MQVDSDTAAYILESQRHFEDLRQIAAQLAGLLVLAAAGGKNAGPDHPLIRSAARLHGDALEGLHACKCTERARTHHRHLVDAADLLGNALVAARAIEIDPVLIPLRQAYAQLQRAAAALPGFEMVEFSQGCCGMAHVSTGGTA